MMSFLSDPKRIVSPPMLWGKIPSQGDYIHHRVNAKYIEKIQHWVEHRLAQNDRVGLNKSSKAHPTRQAEFWHETDKPLTQKNSPAIGYQSVPWSFILPPHTLSLDAETYTMGVWIDSSDKIGRDYPLVLFQTVTQQWLQDMLSYYAVYSKDWLFAAGRILAEAITLAELDSARVKGDVVTDFMLPRLDYIWSTIKPTRFMHTYTERHAKALYDVVSQIDDKVMYYNEVPVLGVHALPWQNWPNNVFDEAALPAFWQQNSDGLFISAREN